MLLLCLWEVTPVTLSLGVIQQATRRAGLAVKQLSSLGLKKSLPKDDCSARRRGCAWGARPGRADVRSGPGCSLGKDTWPGGGEG